MNVTFLFTGTFAFCVVYQRVISDGHGQRSTGSFARLVLIVEDERLLVCLMCEGVQHLTFAWRTFWRVWPVGVLFHFCFNSIVYDLCDTSNKNELSHIARYFRSGENVMQSGLRNVQAPNIPLEKGISFHEFPKSWVLQMKGLLRTLWWWRNDVIHQRMFKCWIVF